MGPGESHSIGLRFTPQQFPGKAELLIFINDSEDKNEETFCISALYTWQRYVTSFIALCLSPVSPRVSMGVFKRKLKKATFYLEILICHYSDGNENVQKSNGLRLAKKQLGTCSPLFCTFLCRHCTITMWNFLISRLWRTWTLKTMTFFFFLWTKSQPFSIQLLRKESPTFYKWKDLE